MLLKRKSVSSDLKSQENTIKSLSIVDSIPESNLSLRDQPTGTKVAKEI